MFRKKWETALNVIQKYIRPITLEDNKAVIRRLYDAFSTEDLKAMDDVIAANAVDLTLREDKYPALKGLRTILPRFVSAFQTLASPSRRWLPKEIWTERAKLRGPHRGEVMGIPATGKQVTGDLMGFNLLADGNIAELGRIIDIFGLVQQLGGVQQSGAEQKGGLLQGKRNERAHGATHGKKQNELNIA